MAPPAVTCRDHEALTLQLSAMSSEIWQLCLIVAALSAKLGERREPVATPKANQENSTGPRCFWCDQAGHFERTCPAKQSYRRRKRPRRRRRQRKGQHQQAPPSTPPQQTAHPDKTQNPATPVGSRQASGGGGGPLRRKGQQATVGAELEWDHEPQVLSFLPFVPSAAPVDLAPAPVPVPAKPAAATASTSSVPVAETQQTAQQRPPVARHAATRTSSPGSGSRPSRITAKSVTSASPVTVNSVRPAVPRSKKPETVQLCANVRRNGCFLFDLLLCINVDEETPVAMLAEYIYIFTYK